MASIMLLAQLVGPQVVNFGGLYKHLVAYVIAYFNALAEQSHLSFNLKQKLVDGLGKPLLLP